MNLHQVLTGAVNPGDNCFAVGNINDEPFTAYASGCDIVILGSNFERLQIIPGAKHGNIQVGCVDCSMQQGKIAASYGNVICIFEPVQLLNPKIKSPAKLTYQWQKTGQFVLQSIAHNLAWDPTGTRLLTGSNSLQLWSNVGLSSCIEEDVKEMTIGNGLGSWKCIWQCKTASSIHLMKFSPDGDFFATAGQDDCLVKVWYNTSSWHTGAMPLFSPPERSAQGEVDYSFVYLAHPRTVTGFSWRKLSKYTPRGAVCNVLLTCCKDSVCRLWTETMLPSDGLLSGLGQNQNNEPVTSTSGLKRNSSSKERVQSALELNLKQFRRGRRKPVVVASHTGFLPHQQDKHQAHRTSSSLHTNALCHFHIAASINPATDIPLLPSISSLSLDDNEEQSSPFVVHWLNNKELHFTLSMEVFLQHLRRSLDQQSPETSTEETSQTDAKSDEDTSYNDDDQKGKRDLDGDKSSCGMGIPLSAAAIDHEIEVLLAEWNKNADMLFSIHPMDGSLLVWHVDWLDEYQPGMFRQVQVSFVSRIPVAFPTGDANSLSRSVVMYACTKNVDLAIQQGKQKPSGMTRSSSMLISFGHNKSSSSLKLSIFTPNVLMISKHADGSLNQWAVSFAEESAFSTVLSVSHKSRYCGHRFHLNDLACHSVLPLLLTTSHHNALRTPEVDSVSNIAGNTAPRDPLSKRLSRVSVDSSFQDPNAIYSELILWRVDPVGPLSFSGGVSELARINSLHVSAFSNVAWLPTLIPSNCLGAYGNSPSACFVASDGHSLRLYQAVIEAKKLLSELSNPDISKYVGEVFNIISQQSTARPGCIIELDAITDFHGKETQLLHVFEENFILGRKSKDEGMSSSEMAPQKGFSERFFLVVIEYTQSGHSLLHMWHLHLKSVQITVDDKPDPNESLTVQDDQYGFSSDKTPSPLSQRCKASTTNLQSASRLTLSSERVYSQELKLPDGVEIIRATPSAGHLSSSSLHPTGLAPYLLATSCSDEKVRFWRCRVEAEALSSSDSDSSVTFNYTYVWEEWPLLIENGFINTSTVSVPGRPIEVSCCNTSRIAVAYNQTSTQFSGRDFTMQVGIFECESSGGSQWILEQTLSLDEPSTIFDPRISIDSNLTVYNKQDVYLSSDICVMPGAKHLVHLDWVSREDGSHILTVGIGSRLLMYGQLSGRMPEIGVKEGPIASSVPLWEGAKDQPLSRLVLLRSVDLVSSVEGSLPLPVSLSWVRDGILVVGMDCEMHVYSQWQPPAKSVVATEVDVGSTTSLATTIKHSYANGLSPPPPKKTLTRSMTSLAQKLSGKKTMYDLPIEMEDFGLFKAAHDLFPTLPQYHPVQLMELMDLGKVRRAKAILSHLVKCIAGEVVAVQDSSTNHERRLRSLTISASGSTARDPKTFNKAESSDYTEIDSIPPLPLYALLAADEDTSPKAKDKTAVNENHWNQSDTYDDLFQGPSLVVDDFGLTDSEQEEAKPQVIDLSQYSPTYFGPEHAQVLSSHLLHSSLPGLTRMEQMSLMALADTIATTSTDIGESRDKNQGGETLDECGLKFLLAMRLHTFLLTSLPPAYRAQLMRNGLSTCHFAWAFHSEAEEELLGMLPAMQKGDPTWSELRAMGVGWWVRNTNTLRRCIEKVAKAAFQRNNDPLDAAIFYLAMKKKAIVWGLYRSQSNRKMTEFFSNNFSEDRWRKAALKNAFSLLGKQRFQHSAAFFLLAGSLKDAVEVCIEKMHDIQLALVIARLYESEFEVSSTYKCILQREILGFNAHERTFISSRMHPDPFLRSMANWIQEDYSRALDTLLEVPVREEDAGAAAMSACCNPVVFNFYTYLRTHPLLLRRYFASSEKSSAKMGLTAESSFADTINLVERRLFFTAAHAHFKAGCPMLALEVLSKMPKVVKKCRPLLSKESSTLSTRAKEDSLLTNDMKVEKASDLDWSKPVVNGFGSVPDSLSNSQSDSVLSLDWGQPSLVIQDEPLSLKWDSDKESNSEDEECGLSMKSCKTENNNFLKETPESSSSYTDTSNIVEDGDILTPSEDIIAAQLKFSACLKILTTELRTLSTGYELDGGKLRYQLYHWLEREVVALQKACGYKPDLEDLEEGIAGKVSEIPSSGLSAEDLYKQQRAAQHKEYLQRRRQWLLKNQPLFRMFLSYCSLHGSHGGGLASVRMELILLLQESQQDTAVQVTISPTQHQASIPLLLACTASAKTVVANPIIYLTNLTHDILHTIIDLDSPPHPDIINNKIYVMHTLAASLSACIYQCLCNGHSYSASHANQFTGIVYQSFLLTQQHPVRTLSMDEAVTPNTSPAQWPGIGALIHLLNSAGEEDQPGLTVLLCEILTAVFLSLFVHGLATHSSNELFRIVAHPLNSKMWAAVFGGGARIPIVEKQSLAKPFSVTAHGDGQDRNRKNFKFLSTKGSSRESLQSPTSPVVDQEMPVFKEKFVPPELSIWDYFIAKPFLPPSESRVEYDSEESQGSDEEEEEDDVYASDTQLQEHSNPNSYSWSLMRLAMVQMVLSNLKSFFPMAGHDLSELPVGSPLCHAVLKTLQRWEQVLLRRMEIFGGPPTKFISTHTGDDLPAAGPAILRHKALLEPTNTPFRSSHHSALPVKRLWQYLVKQDEVQETFIRNIFTKKRGQNEIEADLGYPGGKARIIHKESDIITAFAINKANRNCIAIASTHDIQELDVSAILATQILTWIDDEADVENKGNDDFTLIHAREDFSTIQGTTPYTPSSPGTPINMPWLGSMQTGRGASVMIKRNINNVRRMTSHPTLPYYLTGAQDGSVRMFEWGHSQQIICYRSPGNSRVTRIRFNYQGNKFGIVDADGALSLWQTNTVGNTPKPYLTLQCHNKTANDFIFVGSSSLIATAGQSGDNRNVCLWDTLVTPINSLVHAFTCHDSGATVLSYAPKHQLLISGGRKGFICVFDLRQRQQRQSFQAHDSPVKAVAVDPTEEYFITGSAEGTIKIWSVSTHSLIHTFLNEHARQSIFRNIGTGVMQIEAGPANHIFSCGADGTMKMRILPDRFSTMNSDWKNDVKFIL